MKNKENVITDFNNMIINSWTYLKLTKEEKDNWNKVLMDYRTKKCLKGTYNARWEILQAIYGTYLITLGYNGFEWRDNK